MVELEVKLYGVNTISRYELGKPMEIKEAWLFETKMKNGKWANKLGAIGEKGEWVIEIDKENECFKGLETELNRELGIEEPKQSIYKLEFDENAGIILGIDDKPIADKNRRRFWVEDKLTSFKKNIKDNEREREREREQNRPTEIWDTAIRANC